MTTAITVPFHGNDLFIVEHKDQPYTPMKPIVDGMGLDWKSQFTKIKDKFATSMVEITMQVTGDTQNRSFICLPVRKLFGWLMTISPNKVRPELRDIIIMYQNECDDVLWDYWTKGQAINQRLTITPEQQAELHQIVDARAQGSRSIHMEMWARHNRHFKIAKYSQLLAVHFEDAKHYLQTMELKGKREMPVIPVPFQAGKYLVTCSEDGTIKIQDASKYELVDMARINEFARDFLTMHSELTHFTLKLQSLDQHIVPDHIKLPVVGLIKQGKINEALLK